MTTILDRIGEPHNVTGEVYTRYMMNYCNAHCIWRVIQWCNLKFRLLTITVNFYVETLIYTPSLIPNSHTFQSLDQEFDSFVGCSHGEEKQGSSEGGDGQNDQ